MKNVNDTMIMELVNIFVFGGEIVNRTVNGIFTINKCGELVYINNYLLKLLGFDRAKLIYKDISNFVKSCNGSSEFICENIMNNIGKRLYFELYCNDGEIIEAYGLIDSYAIKSEELYGVQVDTHEAEIKHNKDIELELKLFWETAVDLMAIIDKNYKFEMVNDSWTKVTGWTKEEMLQKHVQDIIYTDDIQEVYKIGNIMKADEKSVKFSNRYKCKNGEIRNFEWKCRYVKGLGKFIATAIDTTENLRIQDKNEEYRKQLEQEKIRSMIFSNVSHEFKTPLNIIVSATQLIERNLELEGNAVFFKNNEKYIDSIKHNANRLIKMVNNVVDISKIDAGYYKIHLQNINIVSVVEDITMSVVLYAKNKNLNIIFDTEEEEIFTAVDSEKIERIMLNLLSNAIKNTDSGGTITVNVRRDGSFVEISVEDTGCGIPKDKLELIFTRFMQVDSRCDNNKDGSGIGLALVKSLIEMHKGEIWAESELGKGSKFTFKLPIRLIETDNESEDKHKVNTKAQKYEVELSDI